MKWKLDYTDVAVAPCCELYEEIWRPVVGSEDRFLVSNHGRIRPRMIRYRERIVRKLWSDSHGYKKVAYVLDGRTVSIVVHRAVAQAFIPNPENKPQINHKDSTPANNHFHNLEWCTQAENTEHSRVFGKADRYQNRGERNGNAKLTANQVINIRHCRGEISQQALGELYGVAQSLISRIQSLNGWSHL